MGLFIDVKNNENAQGSYIRIETADDIEKRQIHEKPVFEEEKTVEADIPQSYLSSYELKQKMTSDTYKYKRLQKLLKEIRKNIE